MIYNVKQEINKPSKTKSPLWATMRARSNSRQIQTSRNIERGKKRKKKKKEAPLSPSLRALAEMPCDGPIV